MSIRGSIGCIYVLFFGFYFVGNLKQSILKTQALQMLTSYHMNFRGDKIKGSSVIEYLEHNNSERRRGHFRASHNLFDFMRPSPRLLLVIIWAYNNAPGHVTLQK